VSVFNAFSALPEVKRTLWILRGISLLSAVWWLAMSGSLVGEAQTGISGPIVNLGPAVFVCLVASVVAAIFPLAGGLLFIAGGILFPIGSFWTDNGPFSVMQFAIVAIGLGASLAVYARRARAIVLPAR
jgi:hypothetical protein